MGLRGLIVAIVFIILAIFVIGNAKAEPFDANGNGTQIIGGRPEGCPWKFCGCALAKYLGFDNRDGRWNLAWNWQRLLPRRPNPAPGLAAVRRGHVMLLEQQVSENHWRVYDPNGGRHKIWRHVRSVSGFVFVDPSQRHAGL